MSEKRMTKREYFTTLLTYDEVQANPKMVEATQHELELLDRKNASGEKKLTANQTANVEIKATILDEMEDNVLYTISDMQKRLPSCAELTNQKISALMTQLVNAQRVERVEDKRKAYFRVVRGG